MPNLVKAIILKQIRNILVIVYILAKLCSIELAAMREIVFCPIQ